MLSAKRKVISFFSICQASYRMKQVQNGINTTALELFSEVCKVSYKVWMKRKT